MQPPRQFVGDTQPIMLRKNQPSFCINVSQLWHQLSLNILHLILIRWLRALAFGDVKIYLFYHTIPQLTQYLISYFSHHNQPYWFIYLFLTLPLQLFLYLPFSLSLLVGKNPLHHGPNKHNNSHRPSHTHTTLGKYTTTVTSTTANILNCTNSKPI